MMWQGVLCMRYFVVNFLVIIVYILHTLKPKKPKNFFLNKMLSYRRETALQGTLVLAESGRLELRDNILLIL